MDEEKKLALLLGKVVEGICIRVMEVAVFCRLGILWQRRRQLLYCELLLDVSPLCYLSLSLNS